MCIGSGLRYHLVSHNFLITKVEEGKQDLSLAVLSSEKLDTGAY